MRQFYLLVPCTKRKALPPPSSLQVGSLPTELSVIDRARLWVRRLMQADSRLTPARSLYAGPAWTTVNRVAQHVEKHGGTVLVVSAGYGLIGLNAPLAAYDATFSRGQPNSVVPAKAGTDERATWWATVAEWSGPAGSGPRTVTELIRAAPDAAFLAVLSEPYQQALRTDLTTARQALRDGNLVIVGPASKALAGLHLPYTAALQRRVGGPQATLGVRLAARLLHDLAPESWSADHFRQTLAHWDADTPVSVRTPRARLDDDTLVAFIRQQMTTTPTVSAESLLAQLRRSGQACGKERFLRLHSRVQR